MERKTLAQKEKIAKLRKRNRAHKDSIEKLNSEKAVAQNLSEKKLQADILASTQSTLSGEAVRQREEEWINKVETLWRESERDKATIAQLQQEVERAREGGKGDLGKLREENGELKDSVDKWQREHEQSQILLGQLRADGVAAESTIGELRREVGGLKVEIKKFEEKAEGGGEEEKVLVEKLRRENEELKMVGKREDGGGGERERLEAVIKKLRDENDQGQEIILQLRTELDEGREKEKEKESMRRREEEEEAIIEAKLAAEEEINYLKKEYVHTAFYREYVLRGIICE